MSPLPLVQYAEKCEDAASGLHRFRDSLPRSTSKIAAIVSEFFAISAVLRRIHGEDGSRNYGPSFYQVQHDLAVAFRTLSFTLDDIFDVFVQVRDRQEQTVWEELHRRLELEESFPLVTRLEIYHAFFDLQFRILEGLETVDPEPLRQSIAVLLNAQERARYQLPPSKPRPRRSSRPPLHRLDTPVSPSIYNGGWDTEYLNWPPGPAPEPPQPLSPTFTSTSSQTMASSHTSYSGGAYFPTCPSPLIHWSLRVFDGHNPTTLYQPAFRSNERSVCYGTSEPDVLRHLFNDGFQPAVEVVSDEMTAQFYWRPSDHRARILVTAKDANGYPLYYCQLLTNLKIVRNRSSLQLCRSRLDDGQYTLWLRLNFCFHERMVLFYSTFLAMKCQDLSGIHPRLADGFELESEHGEEYLFSGEIKHNGMMHAIRIFRDSGSGVLRIEAAALRGSRKDVPLWTAFITKYAYDPDWAGLEHGIVSLAAFRPPPYVFAAHYEPPRDKYGHYVLPFTTDNDAAMFLETWAQICSTYGRRL